MKSSRIAVFHGLLSTTPVLYAAHYAIGLLEPPDNFTESVAGAVVCHLFFLGFMALLTAAVLEGIYNADNFGWEIWYTYLDATVVYTIGTYFNWDVLYTTEHSFSLVYLYPMIWALVNMCAAMGVSQTLLDKSQRGEGCCLCQSVAAWVCTLIVCFTHSMY